MADALPRVLLIEDDDDIRTTLTELLEHEGYEVRLANDGEAALVELRAEGQRPCFIVLDLMMPGMNGWSFLKERREDSHLAKIPVAVVTADVKALSSLGEFDLIERLTKPFDWNRLIDAIERSCPKS